MSDIVQLAKVAREQLAAALNALQTGVNVPEALMEVADQIAEAMSVFHRIERSGGTQLEGRVEALANVRGALDRLQRIEEVHPAVDAVMEAVAASLSKAHTLSRYQPPAPAPAAAAAPAPAPAPAIAPAPAPAPLFAQGPFAAPAPAPAPAPAFAPVPSAPSPSPIPRPAAGPAPTPAFQVSDPLPLVAPRTASPPQPVAVAAPTFQPMAAAPVFAPVPEPAPSSPQAASSPPTFSPPAFSQPAGSAPMAASPMAASPMAVSPPVAGAYPSAPAVAPAASAYTPPVVYTPPQASPSPFSAPEPYRAPSPSAPEAYHAPAPSAPEAYRAPTAPAPEAGAQAGGKPAGPTVIVELGTRSTSNFYKGLAGNDVIEHGGMFVATYKIPKIGTTVLLHVLMPGNYEFYVTAIVQWVREPRSDSTEPGFGARLVEISPEGRQLVYRYTRNREPLFYDDL
jgi:Tfp pilus assembly protein PilZ